VRRRGFVLLAGGAVILPHAVRAEQTAPRVLGYLGSSSRGMTGPNVAALRLGLRETGYAEGKNLTIEYRWAEGQYDRLPALAADLVGRKVDAIVTSAGVGIAAAKDATSTIPIVYFGGGDLVAAGTVASLARPGGNITGIGIFAQELNPKRLGLVSELVPKAKVIALLVNQSRSDLMGVIDDVREAAHASGVQLSILRASTPSEIDRAFATFVQLRADALVVEADSFLGSQRTQLVTLAEQYAIPAIYEWREFAEAGGLISYGPSLTGLWRQVGVYAGRILAGAKPADLPIQRPAQFELVVNLKTAKSLGLTIPQSILGRADEVIE
jgi:putative tryptophan/tyrosine transport system substrate-binding protein